MRRSLPFTIGIALIASIVVGILIWHNQRKAAAIDFSYGLEQLKKTTATENVQYTGEATVAPIGEVGDVLVKLQPGFFGTSRGSVAYSRADGQWILTVKSLDSRTNGLIGTIQITSDPIGHSFQLAVDGASAADIPQSPMALHTLNESCLLLWPAILEQHTLLHQVDCAIIKDLGAKAVDGVECRGVYIQRVANDPGAGWEQWWFEPQTGRPHRFDTGRFGNKKSEAREPWAGSYSIVFSDWVSNVPSPPAPTK